MVEQERGRSFIYSFIAHIPATDSTGSHLGQELGTLYPRFPRAWQRLMHLGCARLPSQVCQQEAGAEAEQLRHGVSTPAVFWQDGGRIHPQSASLCLGFPFHRSVN